MIILLDQTPQNAGPIWHEKIGRLQTFAVFPVQMYIVQFYQENVYLKKTREKNTNASFELLQMVISADFAQYQYLPIENKLF